MPDNEQPAKFAEPDDLHRFLVARQRRPSGSLSAKLSEEVVQKLAELRPQWPDHASWLSDIALLPPRTAAPALARAWPDLDQPARRGVIEYARKDLRHGVPATALWLCAALSDTEGVQQALSAAMAAWDRPTVSREFARTVGEALLGTEWPGPFHRLVQAADGKPQPAVLRAAGLLLDERARDLPQAMRLGHLADQAVLWLRSDGTAADVRLKQVAEQLSDASPPALAAFRDVLAAAGLEEDWRRAGTRLGYATGPTAPATAMPEERPLPAAAPASPESEAVAALGAAVDRVADLLRAATLEGLRNRSEIVRLATDVASKNEALQRAEAARAAVEARAAEAARELTGLERRFGDLQAEQAQLHDLGERRYRAGQQAAAARISQDVRLRVETLRHFWEARPLSEPEQQVRALVEDLLQALARNGVALE